MLKHLLTCICLLTAMIASAQTTLVTGNVSDNTGEPLIGASIMQKGSTIGCTTDFDGNFSLKVATPATLVISYVGYHTKEVAIAAGQDKVDVVLSENTEVLDEVVVIGYGTMNRSKMSSSVASISTKELTKAPVGNVASAMQGRAAGVDVLQQGGIAGADVNIVVRGAASLTSTEPLYIVDGVFTNGGLSTLNPADIETMQVLKDGAAAAIYGSRAANGVVLITTKNGQKGKVKVDANFSFSLQDIAHAPDFLNASQWREFANMVSDNSGLTRAEENVNPTYPTVDTDWVNAWTQNAPMYNADASISGGNDYGSYSFSLGYVNQKGLIKKSEFEKYTARTNSS